MSIPTINGTSRVSASTTGTPASVPTVRPGHATPAVEIDDVTQQPVPLRFPWLSKLSQQLEKAARQRPAFPAAPVLGDHLDKSA